MAFRPGRTPAVSATAASAELASTATEPEIPPAVATRIAKLVESSRSEGTRRTYAAGWRRFAGWCEREGYAALPARPVTVAAYLVDAADTRTEAGERAYAVATFGTWIAAINHQHRTTGRLSPSAHELVTATMSGIRREYASAGDRPRTPPGPASGRRHQDPCRYCQTKVPGVGRRGARAPRLSQSAARVRRRAFRRSELSELLWGDHRAPARRSTRANTEVEDRSGGQGSGEPLPYTGSYETCPPCACVRWMQVLAAFDTGGRPSVIRLLRKLKPFDAHVCRGGVPRTARAPLLRAVAKNGNLGLTPLSGAAIHQTIRRRAAHAGYDPTAIAKLGGHSLRARFVTQSTRNGAPTDPPSHVKLVTPDSTPSRCTAGSMPLWSETP